MVFPESRYDSGSGSELVRQTRMEVERTNSVNKHRTWRHNSKAETKGSGRDRHATG